MTYLRNEDSEKTLTYLKELYNLCHLSSKMTTPFLPFMDGLVAGGGAALALHHKYVVASENTVLGFPQVGFGLFPDCGASYILQRLHSNVGMYLALTGLPLTGYDLIHAGAGTHFISTDNFNVLEQQLAYTIGDARGISELIDNSHMLSIYEGFNDKIPECTLDLDEIQRIFSKKTVEEIIAQLEEHPEQWAKTALEAMRRHSPLSLKLTHRLVQGCKDKTLETCLAMEFQLAQHLLASNGDLQSGLDALERGTAPAWQHSTIDEVPQKAVVNLLRSSGKPKEGLELDRNPFWRKKTYILQEW